MLFDNELDNILIENYTELLLLQENYHNAKIKLMIMEHHAIKNNDQLLYENIVINALKNIGEILYKIGNVIYEKMGCH